jgi:hypothetical protein
LNPERAQLFSGSGVKDGKNAYSDQSWLEQSDDLTLLIVKKILWSTKNGRGWLGTAVSPRQSLINVDQTILLKID